MALLEETDWRQVRSVGSGRVDESGRDESNIKNPARAKAGARATIFERIVPLRFQGKREQPLLAAISSTPAAPGELKRQI